MQCDFYLQDPANPETVYLFEAIVKAAEDATVWRGMYAFASENAVNSLVSDPVVEALLRRGDVSLVVGLDAITNKPTLSRLLALEAKYEHFSAKVFWNRTRGLFHPKISHFKYTDGCQTVIVGSGNLTPGGLRGNFEAYTVLRCARGEVINLASWNRFLEQYSEDVCGIDDRALERASRNIFRGGRGRLPPREVETGIGEEAEDLVEEEEEARIGRPHPILVAQVPRAGGRWGQIHYNQEVVERFFRIEPNSTQRVYLVERRANGSMGQEEVRPCVFSETNKNLKIELGAAHRVDYPRGGVPLVILRELQARSFDYMLLMPGAPGYTEMLRLTTELPTVGRGLPRVITDEDTIRNSWPDCPLLM